TALMVLLSASTSFDAAIARAVSLYNEAEWDGALRELSIAEKYASTDAQRLSVLLHEGIMLANVPDPEAARTSWRRGLELDPNAELPLAVSPRVRALFQEVQRSVKQKHLAKDAPKQDELTPKPTGTSPPELVPPPAAEKSHFPIVPVVSLGAGLAA